ncbi:hypothetical protein J3F83DRAFT_730556 [Trichoderma novae-zelandiae]
MASSATEFAMRNTNRQRSTRTTPPHGHRSGRDAIAGSIANAAASRPISQYPYPWDTEDGIRPEDDFQSEGTPYDPRAIVRVLIPVSIAGWLLSGVICILCINGRGKAGRWIPEWYLDSEGTRGDRALVVLWWAAVMVLWPVILPVLLVRKVARVVRGWVVLGSKVRMLQPREVAEEEEEV